jgi:hypothetical protein
MASVDDTGLAVTDTGGSGTPGGLSERLLRHRTELAARHLRTRHRLAPHHLRRAGPRQVEQVGGLFVRGLPARCRRRHCRTRRAAPVAGGLVCGAAVASHWATRNPDGCAGVVIVDGGYSWGYLATPDNGDCETGRKEIQRLFRKLRLPMKMASMRGDTRHPGPGARPQPQCPGERESHEQPHRHRA